MRKALMLGIIAGAVAVVLLIRFLPPNDEFHLDNPFYNGLNDFKKETKVSSVSRISNINFAPSPSETTLFISGPSGTYNSEEISSVFKYLREGGTLVLADDFGSGNSILKGLGLKTRFSGRLVVDPLFRGKSSVLTKSVDIAGSFTDVESLMFNYPTSLQFESSEGKILATSSSFSFFDDNQNGKREKDEDEGPFPMIAEIPFDKGKILVVSDPSIFINSMLGEEENRKFLQTIIQGKDVFTDISHHPAGALPKLKEAEIRIYQIASRFEARYSIFLLLVIGIVRLKFKKKKTERGEDIQNILQQHPGWDKNTLINLKKELEK